MMRTPKRPWANWVVGSFLILALAFPIALHAPITATAAAQDAVIVIDLDASRLTLYLEGKQAGVWPVAVGKTETPSPIGVFHINQKAREWGSGFGTRWLGLDCPWGKFGIHGTNRPSSIGTSASHGCFRMYNKDIEKLYGMVPTGATVIVEKGTFGDYGWALRVLRPGDRGSDVRQAQVRLANLGYDPGSIDGVFGAGTRRALLEFKRAANLPLEDHIDARTYAALGISLAD